MLTLALFLAVQEPRLPREELIVYRGPGGAPAPVRSLEDWGKRRASIVAPLRDGNFRAESVNRVAAAARPVYRLHGAEGRLRVEHPEAGHDFPPSARALAYGLFDEVLRPR